MTHNRAKRQLQRWLRWAAHYAHDPHVCGGWGMVRAHNRVTAAKMWLLGVPTWIDEPWRTGWTDAT